MKDNASFAVLAVAVAGRREDLSRRPAAIPESNEASKTMSHDDDEVHPNNPSYPPRVTSLNGDTSAPRRIIEPGTGRARLEGQTTEDEELLNRSVPAKPRARAPELAAFT